MIWGRDGALRQPDAIARPIYLSLRNDQRLTDSEVFWIANILFVRFEDGFPTFRRSIKLS